MAQVSLQQYIAKIEADRKRGLVQTQRVTRALEMQQEGGTDVGSALQARKQNVSTWAGAIGIDRHTLRL